MARHQDVVKILGSLEAEVMEAMWAAPHRTFNVREMLDELNGNRAAPLAYTTVMTVMARLADKEILRRERDGRGYRYQAALPDAAAIAVREVVRDFGEAAVAQFVDEARADPQLRRRLEKLLAEES